MDWGGGGGRKARQARPCFCSSAPHLALVTLFLVVQGGSKLHVHSAGRGEEECILPPLRASVETAQGKSHQLPSLEPQCWRNVVIFQVAVYPAIKHLYLGKMGCSEARLGDHKQSSLQKVKATKKA